MNNSGYSKEVKFTKLLSLYRRVILFSLLAGITFCWFIVFSSANSVQTNLRERVQVIRDIEYAVVDDISLRLDLYLPLNTAKKPRLVIFIHGGAWNSGDKIDCGVDWLTDRGYAVSSINYRLSQQAIFPAQIHDCKGAVRWLRAHARDYGYRKKRIGAAGSSAGGHLAALLGTTGGKAKLEGDVGGNLKQSSQVQAVLDMYGPTDFIVWARKVGPSFDNPLNPVYQLLGGPVSQNRSKARLASPARHVSGDDSPLLILHGDMDIIVPLSQSKLLHRRYLKAGLPSTLHVIKGAGHGGPEFHDQAIKDLITSFFNEYLKKSKRSVPPSSE